MVCAKFAHTTRYGTLDTHGQPVQNYTSSNRGGIDKLHKRKYIQYDAILNMNHLMQPLL